MQLNIIGYFISCKYYILLDIVHVYESRMKATMSHELKFQRDKKGLYSWDTN